jgi:hypothetical protein
VPVCLVSVRGSAVRVRQGVFSVFFLSVLGIKETSFERYYTELMGV